METTTLRSYYRNLALASLGAVLEYYDFIVFVYVASTLSAVFFPPDVSPWLRQVQTFMIYAVGYLVRPLAGVVLAHFADRIGRKKLFTFNVLLMSVPTFLIGLLPTYAQIGMAAPLLLVVLRALQGSAMGGEIPSAAVFVAEHAPPSKLNLFSGFLHMVQHLGLLIGVLGASLGAFVANLDPSLSQFAWRLPFLIGGLMGLTAAYLRRQLQETPLFLALKERSEQTVRAPARIVLAEHRMACLIGIGFVLFMALINGTLYQFMVSFLVGQYGVAQQVAFNASMVGVAAFSLPMPLWGWIADRIGAPRLFVLSTLAAVAVTLWFFATLPGHVGSTSALIASFVPLGLGTGLAIALVPGQLAALFPTAIRQSGYALPYNVSAAVFAGLTPLALSILVRDHGAAAPMWTVLAACTVMLGCGVLLAGAPRYLGLAPAVQRAGKEREIHG